MSLIKPAYTDEGNESGKNILRIRLNDEEQQMLQAAQRLLFQPKAGTALKQLAKIGFANVANSPQVVNLLDIIYNNKRKNKRLGIPEEDNFD